MTRVTLGASLLTAVAGPVVYAESTYARKAEVRQLENRVRSTELATWITGLEARLDRARAELFDRQLRPPPKGYDELRREDQLRREIESMQREVDRLSRERDDLVRQRQGG